MDREERLKEVVKREFIGLGNPEIRVMAYWENDTAHLVTYLPKELSESEMDDIDCVLPEIIAQFSEGFFEEKYVLLSEEPPLPISEHWAYLRLTSEEFKYAKLCERLRFSLNGRYELLGLQGVAVDWQNNVISIYFYTYAFPQNWLEAAFVGVCAEIAYQCPIETVEKHIIQIESNTPLPNHKYWAFKKTK